MLNQRSKFITVLIVMLVLVGCGSRQSNTDVAYKALASFGHMYTVIEPTVQNLFSDGLISDDEYAAAMDYLSMFSNAYHNCVDLLAVYKQTKTDDSYNEYIRGLTDLQNKFEVLSKYVEVLQKRKVS